MSPPKRSGADRQVSPLNRFNSNRFLNRDQSRRKNLKNINSLDSALPGELWSALKWEIESRGGTQ
jgi:hypothetical protein